MEKKSNDNAYYILLSAYLVIGLVIAILLFYQVDPNNRWTVVVSATTVIAMIVIAHSNGYYQKKQLDQSRKDVDSRIRPTLARTIIGKSNKIETSGDIIHENVYNIKPEKVLFHFTNLGSLPAVNIRKKAYVRIWNGTEWIRYLSTDSLENQYEKLPDMAPNEKYSIDINWTKEHYDNALNSNNCFFGLLLYYQDPYGTDYSYHMQGHFFDKGYLYLDDVTIT